MTLDYRMLLLVLGVSIAGCPFGPRSRDGGAAKKTSVRSAIERGSQPGANLADAIGDLDDSAVTTRQDAEAICDALAKISFAAKGERFPSDLRALVGLFQEVEEAEAFAVLHEKGISHLTRIFDASLPRLKECDEDDLLFLLKILAMYETREGAERVVKAAKLPLAPDGYLWSVILGAVSADHPERDYIYGELARPLPEKFIAVALLDSANSSAQQGELRRHPFDSDDGINQLKQWLTGDDPDHYSYAVSAAVALAFLKHERRGELLELAWKHAHVPVRIEAAWSDAKQGNKAGLDELVKLCLDVNYSHQAQDYLDELGRADLVPAATKDPDFRAKAKFAQWLAHPNELAKPPDEVEIVDKRTLRWPPEREEQPFWLIRYRLRDTTGLDEDDVNCGLVGSTMWCFFSYDLHQRPPEDAYAIHCYWEMEGAEHITELEENELSKYKDMLEQWTGEKLQSPEILTVAELSPQLKYPQQRVAVASARLGGKDGWVVLDGPRSAWYLQSDMPADTSDDVVLMIHVGRQLLRLTGPVDRAKYVNREGPKREPQQIAERYEKLLAEATAGDEKQREKLLSDLGAPISKYFNKYVDALVAARGVARPAALVQAYERVLEVARSRNDEPGRELLDDSLGPLENHFEEYVAALLDSGRRDDVLKLIETFSPRWEHNLGYGHLGSAAFKARRFDLAEPFLVKLRQGLEDHYRSEEMSMLAEIWVEKGRTAEARELLVDCLQKLVPEARESKYRSDRKMYEDAFQLHRQTFVRLFPDLGEKELARLGIPQKAVEE